MLIFDFVTQWRLTCCPQAFLFRHSDLVADAFTGDFAFELCEAQQHVQG